MYGAKKTQIKCYRVLVRLVFKWQNVNVDCQFSAATWSSRFMIHIYIYIFVFISVRFTNVSMMFNAVVFQPACPKILPCRRSAAGTSR